MSRFRVCTDWHVNCWMTLDSRNKMPPLKAKFWTKTQIGQTQLQSSYEMSRWGFWDGRTGREGSLPTPMAPFPLFQGEMIRIMGYTRRRERAFSFPPLSASSNEDLEVRAAASLASASEEENDCGRKGNGEKREGGRSSAARVFYSLRCRRSLTTFFESAAFRHRRRVAKQRQHR